NLSQRNVSGRWQLFLIVPLFLLLVISQAESRVYGAQGAIWTTRADCGSQQQNVNHFAIGDSVYIKGSGFSAGTYDWDITGQPGGASGDPNEVVEYGEVVVDGTGAFCFFAYVVKADDWGEYKVRVDKKNDNYHVTPANDPPGAVDDAATVAEDSAAYTIDVLANDSDVDGDILSVDSVTGPANGT
ncbi:unnamed protein product, partial [marine sediment metagenome]